MAHQVVTDQKGNKVSIIVPYKDYEKMMKALENASDERAFERARKRKAEALPAREAFKQIEQNQKINKSPK